jgi:hypothetical protein
MLNLKPGLILGFFVVLLIACVVGILSITLFIQNVVASSDGNCSTRGVTTNAPSDPTVTVQKYFYAVKNKDYNRACTYFDPKGTINVGKKVQLVSIGLLKSLGAKKGILKSFNIVAMSIGTGNIVVIVVDVTRSNRNQPYELHFSLQQEGGGWKIKHEDDL